MRNLPIIVLAEDDEGHALLIQHGLRKAGFLNPVVLCRNGQEALDFLEDPEGGPAKAKVLLLDISMPGIDGVEVLRRIRSERKFDALPVIMITTTDDPQEVARCHALGCSHYIVKTVNWNLFHPALRELERFLNPPHPSLD
jgi:CheY-like chemotaxis protein